MDDDEDLTNIPAEQSHDTSRDDNTSDCIIKKKSKKQEMQWMSYSNIFKSNLNFMEK